MIFYPVNGGLQVFPISLLLDRNQVQLTCYPGRVDTIRNQNGIRFHAIYILYFIDTSIELFLNGLSVLGGW